MPKLSVVEKLYDAGPTTIALRAGRNSAVVRRWIKAVERGERLTESQARDLVIGTREARFPLVMSDFE